jgi:hypothetical protein
MSKFALKNTTVYIGMISQDKSFLIGESRLIPYKTILIYRLDPHISDAYYKRIRL